MWNKMKNKNHFVEKSQLKSQLNFEENLIECY